MFKKFVKELASAKEKDEYMNVFYREGGINQMFNKDKLTAEEYTILSCLIAKLAN